MVVMFPRIEFVAVNSIPEITTAHQVDLLEGTKGTINSDRIAHSLGKALVQFLRAKRAMLAGEHPQQPTTRCCDAVSRLAQSLQGGVHSLLGAMSSVIHNSAAA